MRKLPSLHSRGLCAGAVVLGAFASGCSSSGDGNVARTPLGLSEDKLAVSADASAFDASIPPFDAGPPPPPSDASFPNPDGGFSDQPSGVWHFDDCSAHSGVLVDATGGGANATHRLGASCVAGASGLAVSFRSTKDVVEIPDDPQFALTSRIAVAAWVNPTDVTGTRPIVTKASSTHTPFSLFIHNGNIEFSVQLASGKTVTSTAPITANAWSHVGGIYDGQFVFLFLNGEQVGQIDHAGVFRDVQDPIAVGASPAGHHFDGAIDEVWISTNSVQASDITSQACIRRAPTVQIAQAPTGAVTFGTTVNYTLALTDNDFGFCQSNQFFLSVPQATSFGSGGGDGGVVVGVDAGVLPPPPSGPAVRADAFDSGPVLLDGGADSGDSGPPSEVPLGLTVSVPNESASLSPGQTFDFSVAVTASVDTDPGHYDLPFSVFSFEGGFVAGSLGFDLAAPSGCFVTTGRELMVIDPSVVDDPVRTAFNAPSTNPHTGVWTFGRLMRDMAPTPDQAPAFVLSLFQSWLTDQNVNGFTVHARPQMQQLVLDGWPKLPDGSLDLNQSPLRLLAIVNRIDTRNLAAGNAGEARFVFGVMDGFGPLQFTLIVEYGLQAKTEADVLGWANAWHALAANPLPSEAYNAALEALTLKFSGRGVNPSRPNGNGLDQLRTNEIALAGRWELREFGLSPTTGQFREQTIALTPDLGLNGSTALADFINQNQAAILASTDTLPMQFEGAGFQGASVFNDLISWTAPGVVNNDARFDLSSNTCNGCHGPDTGTTFLQIAPRFPGQESVLSGFLTGTTAFDAVSGQTRVFNDLARRNADLAGLVCPPSGGARTTKVNVAKGIRRTH